MPQGYILHDVSKHVYQLSGTLAASLASLVSAMHGVADPLDIPVGALLVAHSADQSGNGGATFDGSWKRLDADANVHDNLLLGRIATGGDLGPSVQWANAGSAPRGIAVSVWTGDVWPDINTIVSGTSDRGANSTNQIVYGGCAVADDFALLIAAGRKFKTAASNTATIGALTDANFTQIIASGNVPNGNTVAMAWNYWQQSTKSNIAQMSQALSIADASAINSQGSVIVLKSQVAAGGLGLLDDRSMRGEL